MGRYVTCEKDIVWKYRAGAQPSEISRIPEELNVGRHFFVKHKASPYSMDPGWNVVDPSKEDCDGDLLILRQADVEDLQRYIDQPPTDQIFREMLQAVLSYMQSKPQNEEFYFFGEF